MPEDTWKWEEHGGFADELGIPYDQHNIIARECRMNEDRVSAAVKWLQENRQMFWRVIVLALDAIGMSTLADEAREFLEPSAGNFYQSMCIHTSYWCTNS